MVYMGGSTSSSIWFPYSHGFRLLHENSGWEYFCSEEMRGGFLRLSLEQTLVFSHMRLVGKQEGAVDVGTCLIPFLILFVYCSFVFPFIFTFPFLSIFIVCQQKEFLPRLLLLLE